MLTTAGQQKAGIMRRLTLCMVVLSAVNALTAVVNAGIISAISLANFGSPTILDFETVPTGNISGSDSLFTTFGITSVSVTASDFTDVFGGRSNSSRALWVDSSGLAVVDPLTTSLANSSTYTINFAAPQFRFGVGIHDQAGPYVPGFSFFAAGSPVGVYSVGVGNGDPQSADLNQFFFSNTDSFDRVVIGISTGGFGIDNITLDSGMFIPDPPSSTVPEPASLAVWSVLGLIGLATRRRRKRTKVPVVPFIAA